MEKPIIGVLPLYDEEKDSYWMLPGYMKAIEKAGGIPVMLPLTTDTDVVKTIAAAFDGFLFTGGQDVNPELYSEKAEAFCGRPCLERDQMEEILFKEALDLDKPIFGICRAIQLFNALLGGTLYQDLPTQFQSEKQINHKQTPPYDRAVHLVYVDKEGPLYSMLETESLMVNSYHHQGIKDLSNQLVCAARAEDGLIEAVGMQRKKFVLAVQWHPEFVYQADEYSCRLFSEFVNSCKE